MQRIIPCLALAGLAVSGCGSTPAVPDGENVPITLTLAEARAMCEGIDGGPIQDAEWNTLIMIIETLQNDGYVKSEAITEASIHCQDAQSEENTQDCLACVTALVDAIWE